MKKYIRKISAALILGAALFLSADSIDSRAAEAAQAQAAAAQQAADTAAAEAAAARQTAEAAAAQAAAKAQALADAQAAQAAPEIQAQAQAEAAQAQEAARQAAETAAQAEARAQATAAEAAAAKAAAEAEAAQAAAGAAAEAPAGAVPPAQPQTPPVQTAEPGTTTQTPAPNASPGNKKGTSLPLEAGIKKSDAEHQKVKMSEQLKKDIESSLEEGAKDAIINGYLSLLNKDYILKNELDINLESIGNGHKLEARAARIAAQMVRDAKKEKIYLNVTSSYRTYSKQVTLFKNKIARLEGEGYSHAKAVEEAGTVVAVPGTSEHQLGLSLDFVTNSYKKLDEGIRDTKEYQWVEEHAWEYGYVIRYPKGKSHITGIISEPWHLRYVGIPAAKLISEQGLCLEEFLGVAYDGQKDGISYGAGWINTGR